LIGSQEQGHWFARDTDVANVALAGLVGLKDTLLEQRTDTLLAEQRRRSRFGSPVANPKAGVDGCVAVAEHDKIGDLSAAENAVKWRVLDLVSEELTNVEILWVGEAADVGTCQQRWEAVVRLAVNARGHGCS
jgi:hypothetical protein